MVHMVSGKFEPRNLSGLKVFKGTAYGPAEYLSKRAKRSRRMTQEEMDRYDRKVTQTKGFDVDGCTGTMPGRIIPIPPTSIEWEFSHIVARWAAYEIGGKRLEVLSLDKANMQPVQGSMYYVTFTAIDTVDKDIKHYRAKVWRNIVKFHMVYFKEFKSPKKAVTRRKARGRKLSNGSKRPEAKMGTIVQTGGSVLAGFTAFLKKVKSENPSMIHAKEKQTLMSEASSK